MYNPKFTGQNLLELVYKTDEVGRQILVSAVLHAFNLEELVEEDADLIFELFANLDTPN